jgi:hypothetical protein
MDQKSHATGYATAPAPLGPWTKSPSNPLLKDPANLAATGSGHLFKSIDGNLFYIFQSWESPSSMLPRSLYLAPVQSAPDASLSINPSAIITPKISSDFPLAGKLTPRHSLDGPSPLLGIGFEKLDRDVFDPEKAYDKLAAIGIKYVRLQSGWQRTEKKKGSYDFAWLDSIVNNLIQRGLTPWLCLCYGNELHTPAAKKFFGAVGVPPIKTQAERDAWDAYVRATVSHFKDRIHLYEIWNEPDGDWCWKPRQNPYEYGEFAIATAKTIRATDPSAQIAAFGITSPGHLPFLAGSFDTGLAQHIDAVTYHYYTTNELAYPQTINAFRSLLHSYNPNLKIIQGESGAQSRPDGEGALRRLPWTPLRQA